MTTFGIHVLIEMYGCSEQVLADIVKLELVLRAVAAAANATVLDSRFYQYSPHGVTGFLLLAESHLSIHTWPEAGYAAADFFTCGKCNPVGTHKILVGALHPKSFNVLTVERGRWPSQEKMTIIEGYDG